MAFRNIDELRHAMAGLALDNPRMRLADGTVVELTVDEMRELMGDDISLSLGQGRPAKRKRPSRRKKRSPRVQPKISPEYAMQKAKRKAPSAQMTMSQAGRIGAALGNMEAYAPQAWARVLAHRGKGKIPKELTHKHLLHKLGIQNFNHAAEIEAALSTTGLLKYNEPGTPEHKQADDIVRTYIQWGPGDEQQAVGNPRYDIPLPYPVEDYQWAEPPVLAHWSSYPQYSFDQFYRPNTPRTPYTGGPQASAKAGTGTSVAICNGAPCPSCGSPRGMGCVTASGNPTRPHAARRRSARQNPNKRIRKKHGKAFTVFHADHGISTKQMQHIQKVLKARAPQGFFIKQVSIPKRLGPVPNALYGPDSGDRPVSEGQVHYMDRAGRGWEDRMIDAPVRPINYVQTIGIREGDKFTLFTVYGGPLAPQNPADPNNPDPEGARKWWSEHALSSQQWAGKNPAPVPIPPSSAKAKPVDWPMAQNAGPFLPEMFPYGQGGRPKTYSGLALDNPARPNPISEFDRAAAARAGGTLTGSMGWPVKVPHWSAAKNRKQALIALQFMARGFGKRADYPKFARKLAALYPPESSSNREIWSFYTKHRTQMGKRMPTMASLRKVKPQRIRRAAANPRRR